jgi:hypothetical protein
MTKQNVKNEEEEWTKWQKIRHKTKMVLAENWW